MLRNDPNLFPGTLRLVTLLKDTMKRVPSGEVATSHFNLACSAAWPLNYSQPRVIFAQE